MLPFVLYAHLIYKNVIIVRAIVTIIIISPKKDSSSILKNADKTAITNIKRKKLLLSLYLLFKKIRGCPTHS